MTAEAATRPTSPRSTASSRSGSSAGRRSSSSSSRSRPRAATTPALRAAADWTADRLRRLGATVEVLEVDGAPPLVVGEIGDGPRTVTAVQHYDVQPASPLELWTTPPYEPAIRDGRVWARGATDNKGEFLPRVWAVEAWLEAIGPLPCRVRYLVEGQEETGSDALDALLDLRPELREADAALIEGGGARPARPPRRRRPAARASSCSSLACGRCGSTPTRACPSLLPNAGQRLVAALATLLGRGRAARPSRGLDAGVRPPTPSSARSSRRSTSASSTTSASTRASTAFIGGLEGLAAAERLTFEPTLNLQGLWSGHTDPGRPRP